MGKVEMHTKMVIDLLWRREVSEIDFMYFLGSEVCCLPVSLMRPLIAHSLEGHYAAGGVGY